LKRGKAAPLFCPRHSQESNGATPTHKDSTADGTDKDIIDIYLQE
jgi:hypothetical protein